MGDWIRWVNVRIDSISHIQIRPLLLQSVHQGNSVGSPLGAIEPLPPDGDPHPSYFIATDKILMPVRHPCLKLPE